VGGFVVGTTVGCVGVLEGTRVGAKDFTIVGVADGSADGSEVGFDGA